MREKVEPRFKRVLEDMSVSLDDIPYIHPDFKNIETTTNITPPIYLQDSGDRLNTD